MTTAHRPTYKSKIATAQSGQAKVLTPSFSLSLRDMPSQLAMKDRPKIQLPSELNQQDLKKDLLEREQQHYKKKKKEQPNIQEYDDENVQFQEKQEEEQESDYEPKLKKQVKQGDDLGLLDMSDISESDDDEDKKNANSKYVNPFPQDQDDENFKIEDNSSKDADDSDSDSDEDSDQELLMKEFEKIKKEREEEQRRKLQEKEEDIEKQKQAEIMKGNPLLNQDNYSLSKKWYEDTVFKNQAKTEPKEKQKFINDNIRSDFHRKFMNKYIIK